MNIIVHEKTQRLIDGFVAQPSHALLLTGMKGVGKNAIAVHLTTRLLAVDHDKLINHPYFRHVAPTKGSIKIEDIRNLQDFLSRRVVGLGTGIQRIVVIEDADSMGEEAQNAILKTLEEPPTDTLIILTSSRPTGLLPTVRSRVSDINVQTPHMTEVEKHFKAQGHDQQALQQAILMSGGLPGLMHTLLHSEGEHPMQKAVAQARSILGGTTFDRLALVDGLSKDREACLDIMYVLRQMAGVSLRNAQDSAIADRWQRILTAAHTAGKQLTNSGQPKLVLTNFMLNL